MDQFKSTMFDYQDNSLFCENVKISDITSKTGTPVFIYSKNFFITQAKEFNEAFSRLNKKVFYAVKANFNINVIKTFLSIGCGVDVNSGGELFRALKAGANPFDIIFSGVGKTEEELRYAIKTGLLVIKAESEQELHLIDKISSEMGCKTNVSVRINPDIAVDTHPYITTGKQDSKFGIDIDSACEIYSNHKNYKNLNFTGIDMHIGSQLFSSAPYLEAIEKIKPVIAAGGKNGLNLEHFDLGGGYGVQYDFGDKFNLESFAAEISPALKSLECQIFFEPGRYFTAEAGVLISKILYTKNRGDKSVYIVDAAMTELIRPALYKAYHHVQPLILNNSSKTITADIVGAVCESGDFFAKERQVTELQSSDEIAIMCAGSYGMVMASNYNARLKPPEVMVDGSEFQIIRNRETYESLVRDEILY